MTEKLRNLFHKRKGDTLHPDRDHLIASMIERRAYDVPEEFITIFVNKSVVDILLDDFCKYVGGRTAHELVDDLTAEMFPKLYREINRIHPDFKLYSRRYLKKMELVILPVLLLYKDEQWKAWMSVHKEYKTGVAYGCYLLQTFYFTKKKIPEYILDYYMMIADIRGVKVIDTYISSYNLDQSEYLIKSMEPMNYPHTYGKYLRLHWYNGGSYFPKDMASIKLYLDNLKDLDDVMDKLEENIPKSEPSVGFETYKALRTMMSGLEPEDDDDVGYSFTKTVTDAINHLFIVAKNDINVLWAIVNTEIPCSIYQGILKYDEEVNYTEVFIDLMRNSKVPLKDASLYFKLFGVNRMTTPLQLEFIVRGGSPKTLALDNDRDDTVYNVCYRQEGLEGILYNSSIEDITYLLDFNERFRNFLVSEMNRCSLNYLNASRLKRLFECIVNRKYDTHESLMMIANYIFNLFGEEVMLKEFPYSMKIFTRNRASKSFYPTVVKYLNNDTLPYVPIRLLSGSIIEKFLSRNVLHNRALPILNTEGGCYLDGVLNSYQLDNLIVKKGNIEYIPYLSIGMAEHYISEMS